MKHEEITKLHTSFEAIVQKDKQSDIEFWLARDLQKVLGYSRWEIFLKLLGRLCYLVRIQVASLQTIFVKSRKWLKILDTPYFFN